MTSMGGFTSSSWTPLVQVLSVSHYVQCMVLLEGQSFSVQGTLRLFL